MQKNEPENFKKVVKIMLPKDYLAYRLSGSFVQMFLMLPVCFFLM